MNCNICNSLSNLAFRKKILNKYDISFFKCSNCGFLQTEEPYWLDEAYRLPYTPLDIHAVSRPIELSQITKNIITNYFDQNKKFLDYGGGVGIFTRLMRDRGLNFYRQDKYAQNLFAQFFDVIDLPESEYSFELVTCFEVLEHLVSPLTELEEIFSLSKNLLCSTILQPKSSEELETWFYLGDVHGQHISFYTNECMKLIAERFNCYYYSNNENLHLFSDKKIDGFTFKEIENSKKSITVKVKNKLIRALEKAHNTLFGTPDIFIPLESLSLKDIEFVTNKLQKNQ